MMNQHAVQPGEKPDSEQDAAIVPKDSGGLSNGPGDTIRLENSGTDGGEPYGSDPDAESEGAQESGKADNRLDPGEEVRGRLTAGLSGLLTVYGDEALVQLPSVVEALRPGVLGKVFDRFEAGRRAVEDDVFFGSGSPANELPSNPLPPLCLFFGLYAGGVTLLVGETGAGKSSALYNLAIHAALNQPLWGVAFGLGRPIRVWYLDPENARLQAPWKLANIGMGRPPDLVIDPAVGADLSRAAHQTSFYNRILRDRIDLVILDPFVNLFRTQDENNNAEAVQQMVFLEHVAQETMAAILLIHHTGKIEGTTGAYGRGASARLASAAVGMIWRSRSDDQEDDTFRPEEQGDVQRQDECRLQVAKNRLGGKGSIYLRMVGSDRFGLSTVDAWRQATGKAVVRADRKTKLEIAVEAIDDYVMAGGWKTRAEIIAAMAEEGLGETNVDKALKKMGIDGDLNVKPGPRNSHLYAWPHWVASGETDKENRDADPSEADIAVDNAESSGVETLF